MSPTFDPVALSMGDRDRTYPIVTFVTSCTQNLHPLAFIAKLKAEKVAWQLQGPTTDQRKWPQMALCVGLSPFYYKTYFL